MLPVTHHAGMLKANSSGSKVMCCMPFHGPCATVSCFPESAWTVWETKCSPDCSEAWTLLWRMTLPPREQGWVQIYLA